VGGRSPATHVVSLHRAEEFFFLEEEIQKVAEALAE